MEEETLGVAAGLYRGAGRLPLTSMTLLLTALLLLYSGGRRRREGGSKWSFGSAGPGKERHRWASDGIEAFLPFFYSA